MRIGFHNHYDDERPQKVFRSDNPSSGSGGAQRAHDNARHSSSNSAGRNAAQNSLRAKDRRAEATYAEYVDRLPDPSKCQPCKLAQEEVEAGLITLLAQLEAKETTPEGDKDILRCAAELRRLLSTRNEAKHTERLKLLDKARPAQDPYIFVPEYIEHRLSSAHNLPPLPPISPSLHAQVFTHASVYEKLGRIRGVASTDDISYERFEFIGDAYLELMATRLIAHRLPALDVPAQAHFREQLVRNDTLSRFSRAYGLPDRLEHSHVKQEGKTWDKITADVFEAYVAAVVYSDPIDGFVTAETWMTQLWASQMLEYRETILVENVRAQEELMKRVHMNHIKLNYVDEKSVQNAGAGKQKFMVGVYLTGWGYENEWLGSGEGQNKQQAAVNAAQDALKRNSAVLQAAVGKKEAFMAEQDKERDRKREALRRRCGEGERQAYVDLSRILGNDIRIKKKMAGRGDEEAKARLGDLEDELAALEEKFGKEGGEVQNSTSAAPEKNGGNGEMPQKSEAPATSTLKKQKKKKDAKPEVEEPTPAKAERQSAEDFLSSIISGGNTSSKAAPKDAGSYLEREQKKKEKEERRKVKK